MSRPLIVFAIITIALQPLQAQLEHIPEISAVIKDASKLEGVIVLETRDFHYHYGAAGVYPSTLQVIDPLEPWPPLFFASAPPGGKGMMGNGTYQDVRYQHEANVLTFFRGIPGKAGAYGQYLISDTNFIISDTVTGPGNNIDSHDFQVNARGEMLFMTMLDTLLDLSPYTGNAADTAVLTSVQEIAILDAKGRRVFLWNPLDHIPIPETSLQYNDLTGNNFFTKGWDWSHGNSVRFTHEGNIIYSYRHLGLGKVHRQTGRLLWKLGGEAPTIAVPPGGQYYEQHDFQEIAPGRYSVFSNGDETAIPCRGIIYDIDDRKMTARLVRTYEPDTAIFSMSMGSYETPGNGLCVFNYGRYATLAERQPMFEVTDTSGRLHAVYTSPALTFSFQVHLVPAWKPSRPVILHEPGTLRVDKATGEVVWYRMVEGRPVKAGSGATLQTTVNGAYIAIVKTGFGWKATKPVVIG